MLDWNKKIKYPYELECKDFLHDISEIRFVKVDGGINEDGKSCCKDLIVVKEGSISYIDEDYAIVSRKGSEMEVCKG